MIQSPSTPRNRLVSWFNDKNLLSGVDVIGWNFLFKKKKKPQSKSTHSASPTEKLSLYTTTDSISLISFFKPNSGCWITKKKKNKTNNKTFEKVCWHTHFAIHFTTTLIIYTCEWWKKWWLYVQLMVHQSHLHMLSSCDKVCDPKRITHILIHIAHKMDEQIFLNRDKY